MQKRKHSFLCVFTFSDELSQRDALRSVAKLKGETFKGKRGHRYKVTRVDRVSNAVRATDNVITLKRGRI